MKSQKSKVNSQRCNSKVKSFFKLFCVLFIGVIFNFQLSPFNSVQAAIGINKTINFQGKLVDNAGLNVSDGNYSVVFTLYDAASGGNNLWDETQTVAATDGLFQVALGSVDTTLGNVDFNSDNLYLGIKVGADSEMTPRIRFAAVPYALNAQKVAGLTVTNTTGTLTIPDSTTIQFGAGFTTGSHSLTLNTTGVTALTLPTTGTLLTAAGAETLTNKTIGSTGLTFSGSGTDVTTVSNEDFTISPHGSGNINLTGDADSQVLIGQSGSATEFALFVNNALGSNAALAVNNPNSGDIFTASSSGTTRFSITSPGGIKLGSDMGSANDCLLSGGPGSASTWGNCDKTQNYWQLNSGAISPFSDTADVLIGATASTSARFAFLNVSSLTEVPTASVSATDGYSLILDADGNISTTQAQTLTLGGNDSGDVYTASVLRLDATHGIKGGGLSDCDSPTISKLLWDSATNRFSCGSDQGGGGGGSSITVRESDSSPAVSAVAVIEFGPSSASSDEFIISDEGSNISRIRLGDQVGLLNQAETATGGWTFNTADTTFTTKILANGGVDTTANTNLALAASGTGHIVLSSDSDTGILIGSASNTPAPLSVSGGIGTNAAFILDQLNSGDIFTASAAGTTRFSITNQGGIRLGANEGGLNECLLSGGTGSAASWAACPGGSGGTSYWNLNSGQGSLSPVNQTLDLLMGGTATASAKFAVLNLSQPRGTQIASISGDIVLDSTGSLVTTNAQTLTIGGGTTGDIVIDAGGSGSTAFSDTNINFSAASTTLSTIGDLTIDSGGGQVILSDGNSLAIGGVGGGLSYNAIGNSGTTSSHSLVGDQDLLLGEDLEVDGALYVDGVIDTVFTNNGGVIYTNATGVIGQTTVGNLGECLVSQGGGSPVWQSCSGAGGSNWDIANGTITPKLTNTLDFLLGGSATSSAKFAVLNISSGIPVASVSAGAKAAYLTGDGVLGTTSLSQLSIGGPTTGDLVFDSQTGNITFQDGVMINGPLSFQGSLTVDDGQYIGLGATAGRIVFTNSVTDDLDIQNANIDLNNNLITNIGHASTDFTTGGGLNLQGDLQVIGTGTFDGIVDANGLIALGDNGDTIALDSSDWDITTAGVGTGFDQWSVDNIDLNGQVITFSSTIPSVAIANTGTLAFTDGSNTLLSLADRGTTGALVMPDAGVISIGGSGSTAAYNIFGDSTTGAYATDLTSDDDVYVEGNIEIDGTVRLSNQTLTFPSGAGVNGYLLSTNGSGVLDWKEIAGTIERWAETSKALHPTNSTWDFLIGGESTESAKFAFINVSGGIPTASIAGNLTLNSTGVIQTTERQTMTLGGSDTGDIVFNPRNNESGGMIRPASDNVTDLGASSSARFRSLYLGPASLHVQCLTGDGCGQNLDYELGVDTADNGFYIGVNGNGIPHKALSITEGGNVDVLGSFSSGLSDAFSINSSGDVLTSGTITSSGTGGIALTGTGSDLLFANQERIANDTNGTITLGRNETGTVTLTSADDDLTAAFTILSGGVADMTLDTGGAAAVNIGTTNATSAVLGSSTLGSFTVATDATGDSEVVLPTDAIGAGEVLDDSLGFSDLSDSLALDATTTITPGTNNLVFNLDNTGDFIVQDAATAFVQFLDDGTITLGKSAVASTLNLGTGTGVDTINIGTGTVGADVITIGNNTGTISLDGTNFDLSTSGILTMGEELILSATSGEGLSGGGLTDCNAATDKLQWDAVTNQFSCGTDTNAASVYDAYDNAGGQTVNGTPIVVNIDTVRRSHTNYTLTSDAIAVGSDGTYSITYTGGAVNASATRGSTDFYIEIDTGSGFAKVDGTDCISYNRSGTDASTCAKTVVLDLNNGDDIRIGAVSSGVSTMTTRADTSSIVVAKLEDTTGGGGGGGINGITVRETDGSPSVTDSTTLEFGPTTSSAEDFVVTDIGSGVSRVTIGSQIARLEDAEIVTGGWTFNTAATTFSSALYSNGGIDTTGNTSLSLASAGTGDITLGIDGDSNVQLAASAVPTVDMLTLSNAGRGITTTGVDGIQIDFETSAVIGTRTNSAFALNVTSGATEASDSLYGINIGNLTSASGGTEVGLNIGTGWDSAIITNNGDINVGTGTVFASGIDAVGVAGITIGSSDVTGVIFTTDGTGDGEIALPGQSIGSSEIVSDTIAATQLASTLTFSAGDFLDLSVIIHDDSSLQGLRLPQATSLTNPTTGEGFLAYNSNTNAVQVFDGSSWVSIAGASVFDDIYDESVAQSNTTLEIDNTSGLAFNLTTTGDFLLQDAGVSFAQFLDDGTITLGKSSATGTLNLGTGTAADTINIGTDITTGDVITIGNKHASNALSLFGGDYNDWYVEATGAAKFNTFAGAGLYNDCDLNSNKIIWDQATKTFSCATDNDSGGNPSLQNVLPATSDGLVRDSDANTINWNWDFTSAGTDAGLNITESSASTNGTQDQQALLKIATLANSTASPLQLTAGGTDVGDVFFDLTGTSDFEIRDGGTSFATFSDDTAISLGANSATFSVDATNIDIAANGTLTLYGTTDIATDTNSSLVFLPNGTGDVEFQTDADSSFTVKGLMSCDTIDTDSNGRFSCGTDSAGGGTGTLDDAYNNGATVTVDAYDVLFNLNDASNDYGLVLNASVNGTIDKGLEFTTTGGVSAAFTTAIDLSDDGIVNALNIGSNIITGANYSIQASSALALGSGSETLALNSSDWDISTTGDLSGIGTIGMDGDLTVSKTDGAVIFDASTVTDTDYWIADNNDSGGDDDDLFQIGKGSTPGSSPLLTIDTNGSLGIGTTIPLAKLDIAGAASISGNLIFAGGQRTIATTAKNTLQLGDAGTGNIQFYSSSNTLTSGGDLTLAGDITSSGSLIASNWDGLGAVALTIGSGDITGLSVNTNGTGDNEVILPFESISANEITNNTLTPTDFGPTLTFSDADFIDLGSILHDDITPQGLRLPQGSSFLNLSSGEGYIAWNTSGAGELMVYNGSGWVGVGNVNFDDVYTQSVADADVSMEINNASGLTFDMTSSGNFVIEDSGTSVAAFEANGGLTFSPNSSGDMVINIDSDSSVGIGTSAPKAALDVRGINTSNPIATFSGTTTAAGLTVDNNGTGDLMTILKSGAAKFSIANSGDVTIANLNASNCDVKANTSGLLFCGSEIGADGVSINTFTASGTWNAPTGISFAQVIVTGGGGGGGGAEGTDTTNEGAGGGGGGGGTSMEYMSAAQIGSSQTVTIGAGGGGGLGSGGGNGTTGGASAFGSLLSANGGVGGIGVSTAGSNNGGAGGAGGSSSGGDINNSGSSGLNGNGNAEDSGGGAGGATYWGGGAGGGKTTGNGSVAGDNAISHGAGGGGAGTQDVAGSASGGDGADGVVLVVSYTSSAGDLAEWYETAEDVVAGDVVSISTDSYEYDSKLGLQKSAVLKKAVRGESVVGIVSTVPFETMGSDILAKSKHPRPIALAGRVPVKVSEANGEIKAGNLLAPSDTPGVAVKAVKSGITIGRALEDSSCVSGKDCTVLILVGTTYSNGSLLNTALEAEGLDLNAIPEGVDLSKIMLVKLLQDKKQIVASESGSEIFTDRVMAGLEVITPRVITDKLEVNTIAASDGKNVSLNLTDDGVFEITDATGSAQVQFDSRGNAFFAGTITANGFKLGDIQGLTTLESRITDLEKLVASQSASTGASFTSEESEATSQVKESEESVVASSEAHLASDSIIADQLAGGSAKDALARIDDLRVRWLIIDSATVSGSLRVQGNGLIEGILNVVDTLTANNVIINQLATFFGDVVFKANVLFTSAPIFPTDTAGYVMIPQGSDKAEVRFEKSYDHEPVISASVVTNSLTEEDFEKLSKEGVCSKESGKTVCEEKVTQVALKQSMPYIISGRSREGFTIFLAEPATYDLKFSWTAIMTISD